MPAQVVVVGRSRRNLFAMPRALPDWWRSIWASLTLRSNPTGAATARSRDAAASPGVEAPRFPALSRDADGVHRCVACHLCVEVCPTRCLRVESEGEGDALRVTRFELETGACIGCGFCAAACPERALDMMPTQALERPFGLPSGTAARGGVGPFPVSHDPSASDLLGGPR